MKMFRPLTVGGTRLTEKAICQMTSNTILSTRLTSGKVLAITLTFTEP